MVESVHVVVCWLLISEEKAVNMSHVQYIDELVREYLLFRGFTLTLKSFDNELKIDKDKGFRVSIFTKIIFLSCFLQC
jgi:hypothetical protein